MQRREFLKAAGAAAGTIAWSQTSIFSAAYTNTEPAEVVVEGMPRRRLGRTADYLSLVGFPGLALVHDSYSQERCNQALRTALERGVNYFDVAPAYGEGKCETRMGIGLAELDRSRIFLACKTKKRDRDGSRRELENSLRLLKTDHFDLYQMHHICSVQEVEQALGPNGALETFLKAREEGKVRHLGFSAHTTQGALKLMQGFRFDTVLFPINFVELFNRDFGKAVLDLANEQGVSAMAIKTMSYGGWPEGAQRTRDWWYRSVEEPEDIDLAWRFTLSRRGVLAGIPPSFLDLFDKAVEAARRYRPVTEEELKHLQAMAQGKPSLFEEEEARFASASHHPPEGEERKPGHRAYYEYA